MGLSLAQMVHRSAQAMGRRLAEVRCVALHTGKNEAQPRASQSAIFCLPHHEAYGLLVPQPGINPGPCI